MDMKRYKIFTHCDLDGIGCAILAYSVFGKENVDIKYCNYDNVDEKVREFINVWKYAPHNYKVYITDISVNEETATMIESARRDVKLFDHHATALWLNKYKWCEVTVENYKSNVKTSGTELFYRYLCRNGYLKGFGVVARNINRFVEIVRDYDTWRWKEALTEEEGIICKQVNDLFYIYGRDEFIEWVMDKINITSIFSHECFPYFDERDEFLLAQKQKDIDIYVAEKDKQLTTLVDNVGRTYGVVFAEQYFSELGNRLCELHPELAYVAIIDISNGKVSYRSVRDDVDLGELAHSFGGGGHKKAAGSAFDKLGAKMIVLNWLNEGNVL